LPAIAKDDGGLWRPLTDDGDALRLAVRLIIGINPQPTRVTADWWARDACGRVDYVEEVVVGGDVAAATRRAIVRVAAEIGSAK
jgi:hypothetical protein